MPPILPIINIKTTDQLSDLTLPVQETDRIEVRRNGITYKTELSNVSIGSGSGSADLLNITRTVYVSIDGDMSNDGQNSNTPLDTIEDAITKAEIILSESTNAV